MSDCLPICALRRLNVFFSVDNKEKSELSPVVWSCLQTVEVTSWLVHLNVSVSSLSVDNGMVEATSRCGFVRRLQRPSSRAEQCGVCHTVFPNLLCPWTGHELKFNGVFLSAGCNVDRAKLCCECFLVEHTHVSLSSSSAIMRSSRSSASRKGRSSASWWGKLCCAWFSWWGTRMSQCLPCLWTQWS